MSIRKSENHKRKLYLEPDCDERLKGIPRSTKYRLYSRQSGSSKHADNDHIHEINKNQSKECLERNVSSDEDVINFPDHFPEENENKIKGHNVSSDEEDRIDDHFLEEKENQSKGHNVSSDEDGIDDHFQEGENWGKEDDGFSNEDLNKKHTITITISKREMLLLVVAFCLRFQVSDTGISSLIEMLNVILGNNFLNPSLYKLWKCFKTDMVKTHFVCQYCNSYLESLEKNKSLLCELCGNVVSTNVQDASCFLSISIEEQIKTLISSNTINLHDVKEFNDKSRQSNLFSDINDGKMYSKFVKSTKSPFLTYNFSVDGMALFNSAKGSLWPILVTINELIPTKRFQNVLLAGLWFGRKEPKMDVYLKPFADEAVKLANEGIMITEPQCTLFAFAACCCADSVARPCIQNTTQYNGYYGCSWCQHPGFSINGTVKYTYDDTLLYPDRTEADTITLMRDATIVGKSIHGVKGPCAMLPVPFFNVVSSFVPDYMHGIFLGVTKYIVNSWFDSRNKSCEYYLGSAAVLDIINERAKKVVWPRNVGRIPRPLHERNLYKASEWRNFLLYLCLPCMKGLLKEKFLKHMSMLVGAVNLLMRSSITTENLKIADELLLEFVSQVQLLYGEEFMTFNVHLLLHYTTSVVNWGPLWCHSMFVYEGYNATLQSFIMGTCGIKSQSVRRYFLHQELQRNATVSNSEVSSFISKLNCKSQLHTKFLSVGSFKFFGTPKTKITDVCEIPMSFILQNGFQNNCFCFFQRMTFNSLILTISYKKNFKMCDNFIYTESLIGKIVFIALHQSTSKTEVGVLKYEEVSKPYNNVDNMYVVKNSDTYVLVDPHNIIGKCTVYDDAGSVLIFKVPQTHDLCT